MTLLPIVAGDADTIVRLIREDDEIARLTGSIHRTTDQALDTPIEDLRAIYGIWATSDDRLVLGIIDKASGELVGEVVLNEWDEGNRSCGFARLLPEVAVVGD